MATTNVVLPDSVSYRQFDYWCSQDYVRCPGAGSGSARHIEPFEQIVLNIMGRLTEAGLPAILAAKVAREAAAENSRDATVRIGIGLQLHIIGVRL